MKARILTEPSKNHYVGIERNMYTLMRVLEGESLNLLAVRINNNYVLQHLRKKNQDE